MGRKRRRKQRETKEEGGESCLRKGAAIRVAGSRFQWPRTGPRRYLVPQGEPELVIRESSIISIVVGKGSTCALPWQFPQGRNENKNPSSCQQGLVSEDSPGNAYNVTPKS